MTCSHARSLFSPNLDGALTGKQMHALSDHLRKCPRCQAEQARLQVSQSLVAQLGRRPVPPELALRIRVALSREMAARRANRWQSWGVRLENALNAFMVPATAGIVSAVVIMGLLFGFFAMPAALQASSNDVPTMLYTPPTLAASPYFANDINSVTTDSIVVEAYVDANGRVQDYRVVSGDAHAIAPQLENMLIFTVFHPATAFGRPTAGRAVLSFSKMTVKG
ncbi:MAG TPA: zf-HC2 domain-containing protein [Terriglobales bacterium]|nr:zf-HC2 domain-containing protein [Terriglobales bacterium]